MAASDHPGLPRICATPPAKATVLGCPARRRLDDRFDIGAGRKAGNSAKKPSPALFIAVFFSIGSPPTERQCTATAFRGGTHGSIQVDGCSRVGARRDVRNAGHRTEEIRHRRERHGDQARPDHSPQRAGFRLWRHRQGAGRLYPHDQRAGRHQGAPDQPHSVRRCLQSAEDGRAGAQARRRRRGSRHLPDHRYPAECSGPEISERSKSAAASGLDRRGSPPASS